MNKKSIYLCAPQTNEIGKKSKRLKQKKAVKRNGFLSFTVDITSSCDVDTKKFFEILRNKETA